MHLCYLQEVSSDPFSLLHPFCRGIASVKVHINLYGTTSRAPSTSGQARWSTYINLYRPSLFFGIWLVFLRVCDRLGRPYTGSSYCVFVIGSDCV
jgi:hypothetical protein